MTLSYLQRLGEESPMPRRLVLFGMVQPDDLVFSVIAGLAALHRPTAVAATMRPAQHVAS